jgi:GAF domain-containing protein
VQVAREAAAIRDVNQLLDETVRLISDRFGFYHAGLFLLDEAGEYAVLRAVSSEGGRRMLERGHKLKAGEVGIVGYVAGTGKARIALDVGKDAVFFDNPDLPGTRSEMALPLRTHDRTTGVLDVQSTEAAAFTEEDVAILQTLADQVALAIENARLLAEAESRLQEVSTLVGRTSREGWERLAAERPSWGYVYDGVEVVSQEAARPAETGPQLTVPLQVRGEAIGRLNLVLAGQQPTSEDIALVQGVVDQASLALESARLYQDTQRRAAREQLTREITDRIRASTSVDDAMQRAAQEMARALGASETVARIGTEQELLSKREG